MIKIGIYQHRPYENILDECQQQSLMPTLIKENEPQYFPVKEIGEKLDTDKFVRNIALTGPYGSGKSSVLYTLQKKYKGHEYLQISLATLESYDIPEDIENKKKGTEQLNRLIEYSILQQLIYREKYATVPNSRIKRIFHFEERSLCKWSAGIVGFLIAYLIAFEPNWLRVETMYRLFDWGIVVNSVFDILSVIYMIVGLFICVRKILLSYRGHHLSKLNLKNGEIELKKASIFNKHLDEIIYFFQRTKYDVVIIEDLDRFNTSDIYLKLRELNQLINESKEIGRHIVFIYAVKDDVFKDAQRAKFFDYISTVIPVINPSNSMSELKRELNHRGYNDIADDDLEEMSFFINDMRLLRNIANEYQQYRTRLCSKSQIKLNPTKLLGMIVYKNCFPNDFAQLHNREGNVYKCIASKPQFIKYAKQQLEDQQKQLEQKIQSYQQYTYLPKKDLRESCAYRIMSAMLAKPKSILLDNTKYVFSSIVDSEKLFEKMISADVIYYQYSDHYYSLHNGELNLNQSSLDLESTYWNRKKILEESPREVKQEQKRIDNEGRRIKSLRLHEFFRLYDMGQCKAFTDIKLEPPQNVFLRRGYIDEDYYDYISYFYPGMITQNDRDLLLAMKQAQNSDYNTNIEKIENFTKKVPLYVFDNDAVLNNCLADFLISQRKDKQFSEKFELLMKRIEREDAPLDFIAQYYKNGTQIQRLFERFIEQNTQHHWTIIMSHSVETERSLLIEGWLRFCKATDLFNEQLEWLNDNYAFLVEHIQAIGLEHVKSLSNNRKYTRLNTDSDDLLAFVIENNLYELNRDNLCIVVNYLNQMNSADINNINLKRITNTEHKQVIAYVKQNITSCIYEFSHTVNDENVESILFILNDQTIDQEEKIAYLQKQQSRIESIENIAEEARELAIDLFLLEPCWENVAAHFALSECKVTEPLKHYIEHYKTELGGLACDDTIAEKESLFDALIGSNILEIETYKAIGNSFRYTLNAESYLADLESDRLDYLIDAHKVAFTKENTSAVSSHRTSTFFKYLINNKNEFLKEAGSITYSSELAIVLFTTNTLSMQEKAVIAPFLNANIIGSNSKLASEICSLLLATNIELNEQCLISVVANSDDIENCVKVMGHAIRKHPHNIQFIEKLLQNLSAPYADIAIHDRKHPVLERNDYNKWLLDVLTNIGYLSSYSEIDKGLKVNKKAL